MITGWSYHSSVCLTIYHLANWFWNLSARNTILRNWVLGGVHGKCPTDWNHTLRLVHHRLESPVAKVVDLPTLVIEVGNSDGTAHPQISKDLICLISSMAPNLPYLLLSLSTSLLSCSLMSYRTMSLARIFPSRQTVLSLLSTNTLELHFSEHLVSSILRLGSKTSDGCCGWGWLPLSKRSSWEGLHLGGCVMTGRIPMQKCVYVASLSISCYWEY